jgi:hypothetical protein
VNAIKIAAHRPMSHSNLDELAMSDEKFGLMFLSCCRWKLNKARWTASDEATGSYAN